MLYKRPISGDACAYRQYLGKISKNEGYFSSSSTRWNIGSIQALATPSNCSSQSNPFEKDISVAQCTGRYNQHFIIQKINLPPVNKQRLCNTPIVITQFIYYSWIKSYGQIFILRRRVIHVGWNAHHSVVNCVMLQFLNNQTWPNFDRSNYSQFFDPRLN